ncbi:MAG: 50S ribosomal protein L21 [Patescibacteria group bacterium]
MQAIIRQSGKQYVVKENDIIKVAKVDDQTSKEISLETLAVFDDKKVEIGTPALTKAKVTANIIGNNQGKKLHIYKYKSKTKYRRKIGHRDQMTTLQIKSITL